MKKVMLIYPAGEAFQRGEDRCPNNVDASVCNDLRACNDLGYISSGLKKFGFDVFLKDYQGEKLSEKDLENDFVKYAPDVLLVTTTHCSVYDDIKVISRLKTLSPKVKTILKGTVFFNVSEQIFDELDLKDVDFLIGGEAEFIAPELIFDIFNCEEKIEQTEGICYKKDGVWHQNKVRVFDKNLDDLPFPDRAAMNNSLYINPATNRPMATIVTSRGCSCECIYCLAPAISGKRISKRSTDSVLTEMRECFSKYKIDNFFFKSDTFTIDKQWVLELCEKIVNSEMNGKIYFAANSRVTTIDEEILSAMYKAGCRTVAFGFESGSQESLDKMKKHTTVEDNYRAIKLCKAAGMKIFGLFIIGLPWESEKTLSETREFIFKSGIDFIEISVAIPLENTVLYDMVAKKYSPDKYFGLDPYKKTTSVSENLSAEELSKFRKDILISYYSRPSYIWQKLFAEKLTFGLFCNYVKHGIKLLKNLFY